MSCVRDISMYELKWIACCRLPEVQRLHGEYPLNQFSSLAVSLLQQFGAAVKVCVSSLHWYVQNCCCPLPFTCSALQASVVLRLASTFPDGENLPVTQAMEGEIIRHMQADLASQVTPAQVCLVQL